MATTTICQGHTQTGERCRLPASRLVGDDPRFCQRFHQPLHRLPNEKPLPSEIEAICQQMINQTRYKDLVTLMHDSKDYQEVCQKLFDQSYRANLYKTIRSHFPLINVSDEGCRALDMYVIQPIIQKLKRCPPEKTVLGVDETQSCLYEFMEITGLPLFMYDYDPPEWSHPDVNGGNSGSLFPFVMEQLPSFNENQCLFVATVVNYAIKLIVSWDSKKSIDQFDVVLALIKHHTLSPKLSPYGSTFFRAYNTSTSSTGEES